MKTKTIALVNGLFFLISALSAQAEQRALLVGVGNYENPKHDLPGIDLDLAKMADTLQVLGYEPNQIHYLLDEQSTADNILREMNAWLVDGVRPEDQVVFYFSGHGSFIPDTSGDEIDDNTDEVLVAHDVKRVVVDGRATLTGIVTDDQIADVISRSASRQFITIVDACHSGTVSRDFLMENKRLSDEPMFERAYVYEGMPNGFDTDLSNEMTRAVDEVEDSFVSISAAGDAEKAIGTSRGGMFTIGFTEAILTAARAGNTMSLTIARDYAEHFIRQNVDSKRMHTPQLTGNLALADRPLGVQAMTAGNGPNWQRLESLAGQGQFFRMGAAKSSYEFGEHIEFSLELQEPGYLNVVSVDAADVATVLFPNQFDQSNWIESGTFTFPTTQHRKKFQFQAQPPSGPTLVVAIVSNQPMNFRELGYLGRQQNGEFDSRVIFTDFTHAALKQICKGFAVVAGTESDTTDCGAVVQAGNGEGATVAATAAAGALANTADVISDVIEEGADVASSAVGAAIAAAAPTQDPEPGTVVLVDAPEYEQPYFYASIIEVQVTETSQ